MIQENNNNNSYPHAALSAGRFLISPMTRALENGWYAASVSVRSGSGRARTDRVLRLTRLFRCSTTAAEAAASEGLRWVDHGPVAA